MRLFLIPAFLLGLLAASPVRSQQAAPSPETLAAAREMMSVVSSEMISQLSSAMVSQALQPLQRSPNVTPEKMREVRAELEKVSLRFFNSVQADAPAIYAKYLTVADMREITVFYRSAAGEKMLKIFPQITVEVTTLLTARMPELHREFIAVMQPILQRP